MCLSIIRAVVIFAAFGAILSYLSLMLAVTVEESKQQEIRACTAHGPDDRKPVFGPNKICFVWNRCINHVMP